MIAILKYNAGNIKSVENALSKQSCECIVTDDFDTIRAADKVIVPGVGEAGSAMSYLKERKIDLLIKELKQPVLGICLGLQLLCKDSEEGNTKCIGVFDTKVKRFPNLEIVPHMGWNNLSNMNSKLFENIKQCDNVYFVHSYFAEINEQCIAECDYILPFAAALEKNNFYATQFHPEKSGEIGEIILQNFFKL
jgi:glutamine amidotransferase